MKICTAFKKYLTLPFKSLKEKGVKIILLISCVLAAGCSFVFCKDKNSFKKMWESAEKGTRWRSLLHKNRCDQCRWTRVPLQSTLQLYMKLTKGNISNHTVTLLENCNRLAVCYDYYYSTLSWCM